MKTTPLFGLMVLASAVSAFGALAVPSVEPRVLVDASSFAATGRLAKWQRAASGWRLEGKTLVRDFPRAYAGAIRYTGGFRLKEKAWLEFLDAHGDVERGLLLRGGQEFFLRGDFRAGAPIAGVRVRFSAEEDLADVLTEPLRITSDHCFDENFATLKPGPLQAWCGWTCTNACVTNLLYRRNWRWAGRKGYDKTTRDHALSIASGGFAAPTCWEALVTKRYAYEFDACVGTNTDFTVGGFPVRAASGLWHHFRFEIARAQADADGWYAATNFAGTARVRLNGRIIADNAKIADLRIANRAPQGDLLVDDVKVFALEEHADYPAPPVRPKGAEKYNVGINVCNLWYEGHHMGWECVDKGHGPKPVLGWYDEGNPEVADWEIKYMVEHGIGFQAVCWYADVNAGPIRHPRLDVHLRDGFKNARYSDAMKYCLIWEAENAGAPHGLAEWERNYVPYFIEHHFKDPRYLTFDGKAVLAVFGAWRLDDPRVFGSCGNVRKAFGLLDAAAKNAGLGGVVFVASNVTQDDRWAKMGFAAGVAYNHGTDSSFERNRDSNLERAKSPGIHTIPTASVGFDIMPWDAWHCPMASAATYEKTLRWCRDEYLPRHGKADTWQRKTVWLATWNEYGEGTYLMPSDKTGFGYLDAVRKVFTDAGADAKTHVVPTAAQKARYGNMYAEAKRVAPQAWTRVLCQQPGRQIGWPTAIRRKNGELWAVFSGDRDAHIDPYGKVQAVRSIDDGETWGQIATLVNDAIDNRDAGIVELPDGDLCLFSFGSHAYAEIGNPAYARHFDGVGPEAAKEVRPTVRRSGWHAESWEKPVGLKGIAPHGACVTKAGRLVYVGRTPGWGQGGQNDAMVEMSAPELVCEISDDGGRSWKTQAKIVPPAEFAVENFHEPHLVEAQDGSLVVQFRYHPKGSYWGNPVLQCESADGGRTWTAIHKTGITGYPPHLLRLRDGRLLTTYARRYDWNEPKRTGLGEFACLSYDNGRTWDVAHEIKIAGCVEDDMGYPSTCELDDGWMLTVYYQSPAPGEKPALMGTKWRLPFGPGVAK